MYTGLLFRSRKNLGNKPFFINNIKGLNELEILESFIPQFYSNRPSPKLILTSTRINEKEIIQNLLASQNKIKVKIQTPLRGEKKEIIEEAKQIVDLKELVTSILMVSDLSRQKE